MLISVVSGVIGPLTVWAVAIVFLLIHNTYDYLNPEEPTILGFPIMISLYKSSKYAPTFRLQGFALFRASEIWELGLF